MYTGAEVRAMWRPVGDLTVEAMRALAQVVFGREVDPGEIARLVAAPDGSIVHVSDRGRSVVVEAYSKRWGVYMTRQFDRRDDRLIAYHSKLFVNPSGEGRGLKVFATAVRRYAEAGVSTIETVAARHDDDNPSKAMRGHSFWAKCGFCLKFGSEVTKLLVGTPWEGTTNSHDLFNSKERHQGKTSVEWWEENGLSCEGVFEIDPNSTHNRFLAAYKALKGVTDDA